MKYRPRNDNVLIQVVTRDTLHGLAMPQSSQEGQEFIVVALGPAVVNLDNGDKVLLKGTQNVDWAFLPDSKALLVIQERNVVAVVKDEEK